MPLMGIINLVVLGLVVLGIIFAAIRSFLSPTALRQTVDRHFTQLPDGRMIFRWGLGSGNYLVPGLQKEQALRTFARRAKAVSMVSGIAVMASAFVLVPLLWPATDRLASIAGVPNDDVPLIFAFANVAIAFGVIIVGLSFWRRSVVRGLATVEKQIAPKPPENGTFADLFRDMPAACRWIALLIAIYLTGECFVRLWQMRTELTPEGVARLSLSGWLSFASLIFGFWLFPKLIIEVVRSWPRRAAQ
jgi:hypothetical protein